MLLCEVAELIRYEARDFRVFGVGNVVEKLGCGPSPP